jgi:hypothetical protein
MHRALLGLAAVSAALTVSTPVLALDRALVGNPTARADRFVTTSGARGDLCRDGDRRRSRDFCRSNVVTDWYGGEWALYNNRSWEPDSYNDWWHDRPDRAYPAWMRHNEGCTRQWYAADTLRC